MSLVIANEHSCLGSPRRERRPSWTEELKLLVVDLFIPTVIIQLGMVIPSFLTASYVGRNFGSVYLDGYTLANLTGNLCNLSLLQGLYSATDTLSPQAFGVGNYREVGLLVMQGVIGCTGILVAVNVVLIPFMEPLLLGMGQDRDASRYAREFYCIYAIMFPFSVLFCVQWKFLSTQNVMTPLVVTVMASCALLPLLLRTCTERLGYAGAALAIVAFQVIETSMLLGYQIWKRPYKPSTWPGIGAWREAIAWRKFKPYLVLGFGGMLASLEWLYWEALSLIVGTLGVVPLSVHTVPTQVLMVAFMFPLSLGIALSIRLGATIPVDVKRAKQLTVVCLIGSALVFGATAWAMWVIRGSIFRFFVDEENVLQGCEEIWWKVCFYYFHLSIFGINMGIATGLGMQWTLGGVTLVALWIFGMPITYYYAIIQEEGLSAAWSWIWPPYLLINAIVMLSFVRTDWDALSHDIRRRESLVSGDWQALLLNADVDDSQRTQRTKNGGHVGYGSTNQVKPLAPDMFQRAVST